MKKLLLLKVAVVFCIYAHAQAFSKSAHDAFMITRMAEKFHFQPRPLNDAFSSDIFDQLLKQLDEDKIFFTAEDIATLTKFRYTIDDEIRNKQSTVLQTITSLYEKRLMQADSIIETLTKAPFNFSLPEKYTAAEDTAYPKGIAGMRSKLYKSLKAEALYKIVDSKNLTRLTPAQLKKYTDSIEPIVRLKIRKSYKREIKTMLQSPGGIQQAVGDEYCSAIASCYDPHTAYMPLTEKENFEGELGNKQFAFGFSLKKNEADKIVIDGLTPGSPAYQSGQLNEGDAIESIKWEGKEEIDVSDAGMAELEQTLGASNHDKAVLKVTKPDGTKREVTLWKAAVEDDEGNKVKSYLLKGSKTIGYLSLPAFYEDWENEQGVNGCANDVAKEIVKLKKENIDGLILDLRYNGGGSMQEAIALAGIFIDAGPVGQVKERDSKVVTLKDVNRGTVYDGPLMLMVNGYSASASEMLAGTLQDYNRALIFGSPTYGKATAQAVFPMDTTVTMDKDLSNAKADSYIKLTVSQLYRITGSTAQGKGVQPDVAVPDLLEAKGTKESDNLHYIKANTIEANKYYKPLQPLPASSFSAFAKSSIAKSSFFSGLSDYISERKKQQLHTDISLLLKDAITVSEDDVDAKTDSSASKASPAAYTVQTHAYESERAKANRNIREMDEQWEKFLTKDPYLKLAYDVMLQMVK